MRLVIALVSTVACISVAGLPVSSRQPPTVPTLLAAAAEYVKTYEEQASSFVFEEEYRQHKGWGHSSWRHAVEVAKQAQVKKLVITHHDPDHDDDFLDAMEKECQAHFPNSVFAREGMELNI